MSETEHSPTADRQRVRAAIAERVADHQSLAGTIADVLEILLEVQARQSLALSQAQSLADVRQAAVPMLDLTQKMLDDIDAGNLEMTHIVKGNPAAVFDAAMERVHATTQAMKSAKDRV